MGNGLNRSLIVLGSSLLFCTRLYAPNGGEDDRTSHICAALYEDLFDFLELRPVPKRNVRNEPWEKSPSYDRKSDLKWWVSAYIRSRKAGSDKSASVNEPKINYGKQKDGELRTIIGTHSPRMLLLSDYKVEEQETNPDGTISVKFRKRIGETKEGDPIWSKRKASTLAPTDWDDTDLLAATFKIARTGNLYKTEADGRSFHRGLAGGIQWEVIMDKDKKITSSYPTGMTE